MEPRTPALKTGAALIAEIRSATVAHGHVALWWLGQATFALKFGTRIVYLEPFYRSAADAVKTMQELPLQPHEFVDATLICGSHEHFDHIDAQTLPGAAAASPKAAIVVPEWTREFVTGMKIPAERLHTLRGDDSFENDGIRVTAIPSAHMKLERDEQRGFKYLGYVIQADGLTIYHPGDTQPYPGWYERLKQFKLDIAFLPISGVDNLYWQQAVYFCALHRPRLAIPIHYGMFKGYSEDPQKLVEGLSHTMPEQAVKVMTVGQKTVFGG